MSEQSPGPAWPADAAERIKAARERGASFEAIRGDFGVSFATVRNKAIALGVHTAVPRRRFPPKRMRRSVPTISRMSISRSPRPSSAAVGARCGSEFSTI